MQVGRCNANGGVHWIGALSSAGVTMGTRQEVDGKPAPVKDTLTLGIDGRLANEPRRVGVGNFCAEVLRALPKQAGGIGLRVYLDAVPRPDFPLTADDAEICVLPQTRFWTQRVLGRELRANPPTVFLSPVLQLPMRCPCPTLATVHDLAYLDFGEQFTRRRRALARFQGRYAVWCASHLLAVSEATRQDLVKHYRIDPKRVTVTQEAASSRFMPVTQPETLGRVRAAHGLPESFVLYVGRLQPRKNLVRLIEAFSDVCKRCPDLPHHLVIAGNKGWLYEPIFDAARRSPFRERIRFLDFVPQEDLPAMMSMADVLALVSLWEGFGLPVLEAMACGTAVLTSNCSSLPEVAGDATDLVDPYDEAAIVAALERLLCDKAHRHELEQRGPVRAAQFSWEASTQNVVAAVRKVTGNL